MELKITQEKVLEAASKCPQAKEILSTLFPEVFKNESSKKKREAVESFRREIADFLNLAKGEGHQEHVYNKIPGAFSNDKADYIIRHLDL